MRKGALFLTTVALLVGGCGHTPFPVLDAKLDDFKGKPIKSVTDVLGDADQVTQVGDATSYQWNLAKSLAGAYNFVSAHCEITVFAGKDGAVTHYSYNGNNAGCSRYAVKLDSNYHFAKGLVD